MSHRPPLESQRLLSAITERFGFVPPFFEPAVETPDVLAGLWQQTLSAYVDNPLPELFKEKLSASLSRYCAVSYCLACHSCSLGALGMRGPEVLQLLRDPIPDDVQAQDTLERLAAVRTPVESFPPAGSPLEQEVLRLSSTLYLRQPSAGAARECLLRVLGRAHYNRLVALINYVKMCHGWMEAHPDVSYTLDARYQRHFEPLARLEPGLVRYFQEHLRAYAEWQREQASGPQTAAVARQRATEAGVVSELLEQRLVRVLEDLHQSELRYRTATVVTRDAIWEWELASDRLTWNEALESQFGYPRGSLPCLREWVGAVHPRDRERVVASLRSAVREAWRGGAGSWRAEYRLLRGDGTEAWVVDRGQVLRDERGEPVRMVGALLDVTEQRKAEEELRRAAEFAQVLLGVVGHDLRNPLSAILTSATLLQRQVPDSCPVARATARILSSARRASRLVADLLDFTQARLGGGIPVHPVPGDIHELAHHVVDEVRTAHPTRRIELVHHGEGSGTWDVDRLHQVLGNLLGNAVAHSDEDSPIEVLTRAEAGEVTVCIHNQNREGPIPSELLPHLFEPFRRGQPRGAERRAGIGLGLYIVSSLVAAHGGRVRVSSTCRGTTFHVHLPRHVPPAHAPDEPRHWPVQEPATLSPHGLS